MKLLQIRRRIAALSTGLLILAAGCAADVEPMEEESGEGMVLSDGLAFRDGDPEIVIVSPTDGSMVTSPLRIRAETANLMLSPSGQTHDGEGHLHILIDQECLQPGEVIPTDSETVHVDNGTGIKEIELSPGGHDLCLQIGDGFHIAVAIVEQLSVFVFEPMKWPGEVDAVGLQLPDLEAADTDDLASDTGGGAGEETGGAEDVDD